MDVLHMLPLGPLLFHIDVFLLLDFIYCLLVLMGLDIHLTLPQGCIQLR